MGMDNDGSLFDEVSSINVHFDFFKVFLKLSLISFWKIATTPGKHVIQEAGFCLIFYIVDWINYGISFKYHGT